MTPIVLDLTRWFGRGGLFAATPAATVAQILKHSEWGCCRAHDQWRERRSAAWASAPKPTPRH